MKTDYLAWMALETPSRWNNDSADHIEIEEAEESVAVGVTTNPPLSPMRCYLNTPNCTVTRRPQ